MVLSTTFSVLICTYNRHEMLARALDALINRTVEKPDQVVIVNGGDERADRVVFSFFDTPPALSGEIALHHPITGRHASVEIKLIKTINKNLAISRNVGLPHCTGDIIAMTDDDAEVFPDWVTKMKRAHREHPEAGAVGGPVIGTNVDTLVGRVADRITFPSWPEPRYVRTLPGVNISYKREVIEQVGWQDETLFRGEDVDFNWRVKRLGYEVYFDPAIKVYHHHRSTLRGFLNQHYMYGRAYYLVRHKWPEMYCVYPHRLATLKDVLKAAHFLIAIFYQPVVIAMGMDSWWDKWLSLPLLFAATIAWKGGMVVQRAKSFRTYS